MRKHWLNVSNVTAGHLSVGCQESNTYASDDNEREVRVPQNMRWVPGLFSIRWRKWNAREKLIVLLGPVWCYSAKSAAYLLTMDEDTLNELRTFHGARFLPCVFTKLQEEFCSRLARSYNKRISYSLSEVLWFWTFVLWFWTLFGIYHQSINQSLNQSLK